MKFKFLAVIFLLMNCLIYSQYRCPLNSGEIVPIKQRFYVHVDESIIKIKSKSDDVFSISNGKVIKIINSDLDYSIIIKDDHHYFVYSNISKTNLLMNDKVKKNQLIAHAIKDKNEYYLLQFQFWEKAEPKIVDLKCGKF